MALRSAVSRLTKPLLLKPKLLKCVQRGVAGDGGFTPGAGWLEKPRSLLFHPKNIWAHKEVIPIGLLVIVGFTCEVLWTIRLAFTRDDVVFLNKKMACERLETRKGVMYPPPVRKFKTYNQQYRNNEGAIAAIQAANDA